MRAKLSPLPPAGVYFTPSPRDCEVATNGRRGEIGVPWVSIHGRPVLPGTMDEFNPASRVRRSPRGDCPPRGLEAAGTTGAPRVSTRSARAAVKWLVDGGIGPKPRSRGEARVSQHAVYRLRDRSLATPQYRAALTTLPTGPPDDGARPKRSWRASASPAHRGAPLAPLTTPLTPATNRP